MPYPDRTRSTRNSLTQPCVTFAIDRFVVDPDDYSDRAACGRVSFVAARLAADATVIMYVMQNDIMGSGEAAAMLGVGVHRVAQLARQGDLPVALVVGGRRLFRRVDVAQLAHERRLESRANWRVKTPLSPV